MGLVARNTAMLMTGVAMVVVWGAGAAFAQSTTTTTTTNRNTSNVTLLERLVIGAGAEKVALDTPQAVTVLDQEALDATQATTTGGIFDSVPGVSMAGSERALGEAFNIRGIGQTENSGDSARIIVTVDGAPKFNEQYRMGSFFSDPELYKRVEVLRGPASSTLYGSGALGGVINFQTKDASDFIKDGKSGAFRIKGAYDSNGQGTLLSGLWAHSVNETFDILATGNWRRADNYEFANGVIANGSEFDSFSGLIKGTARFGEGDEQIVRLSYQRWQSDADGQPYMQTSTQPVVAPATQDFGLLDRTVTDQTVVLSYENPAANNPWLDLNVSLSFSDTQNSQSNSTSPLRPFIPTTPSARILQDTDYAYTTWQLKADNTFDYVTDDFENYFTFGFQASHQDRVAEVPAGALRLTEHPEGIDTRLGLFAQNELIWNDALTLIAGGRADFVWQEPSDAVRAAGGRDINDVALSPKIAALYDFNDNFGIFGSVAHTERLPTLDELYSVSLAVPGGPRPILGKGMSLGLDKETSNNFEAGFTVSGFDLATLGDSLSLKTTAFYNDIDDLIVSNADGSPTYYSNVQEAEIYGIEIEGAYNSDYFFANLAYTATVGNNLTTNRPLATIPAHRIVATLGGRLPEYGLEAGVKAKLVADSENSVAATTAAPIVPQNGYAAFDVFASWKPDSGAFEGTTAQFSVENIFDTDYRDNISTDRSKGRTFKLTLAKQFDY